MLLLKAILTKVILLCGFHKQGEFHINALEVKKTGNLRGGHMRTGNPRGIDARNAGSLSSESALQIQSESAPATETNTACKGEGVRCSTENSGNDQSNDGISTSNELPKNRNAIITPLSAENIDSNHSEEGDVRNTLKNLSEDGNIGNDLLESDKKTTLSVQLREEEVLKELQQPRDKLKEVVEWVGWGEIELPTDTYMCYVLIFLLFIYILCLVRCIAHCWNFAENNEFLNNPNNDDESDDCWMALGKSNSCNLPDEYNGCKNMCKIFICLTYGVAGNGYNRRRVIPYYYPECNCTKMIASLNGFDPEFACQCCCLADAQYLWWNAFKAKGKSTIVFNLVNMYGLMGFVASYAYMISLGVYRNTMCPTVYLYRLWRAKGCVSISEDYRHDDGWKPCKLEAPEGWEDEARKTESAPESQSQCSPSRRHLNCGLCWICSVVQIVSLLFLGIVATDHYNRNKEILVVLFGKIFSYPVNLFWPLYDAYVVSVWAEEVTPDEKNNLIDQNTYMCLVQGLILVIYILFVVRCCFHCCNCSDVIDDEEVKKCTGEQNCCPPIDLCVDYTVTMPLNVVWVTLGSTPGCCCGRRRVIPYYYPERNWTKIIASLNGFDPEFACQCCCLVDAQYLWWNAFKAKPTIVFDWYNVFGFIGWFASYVFMMGLGVYRNTMCLSVHCPYCFPICEDYGHDDGWYPCELHAPEDWKNNATKAVPGSQCQSKPSFRQHLKLATFWICSVVQIVSLPIAGIVAKDHYNSKSGYDDPFPGFSRTEFRKSPWNCFFFTTLCKIFGYPMNVISTGYEVWCLGGDVVLKPII